MTNIRVKDTPTVTRPTAGDKLLIDGATTRSILISSLLGSDPSIVTTSTSSPVAGTTAIAIQRTAVGTATTTISLPSLASQGGVPLRFSDWSTGIVEHTIVFDGNGSETIMGLPSWSFVSTAAEPARGVLYPSTSLGGWTLG